MFVVMIVAFVRCLYATHIAPRDFSNASINVASTMAPLNIFDDHGLLLGPPCRYTKAYCLNGGICYVTEFRRLPAVNCFCAFDFVGKRCEQKRADDIVMQNKSNVDEPRAIKIHNNTLAINVDIESKSIKNVSSHDEIITQIESNDGVKVTDNNPPTQNKSDVAKPQTIQNQNESLGTEIVEAKDIKNCSSSTHDEIVKVNTTDFGKLRSVQDQNDKFVINIYVGGNAIQKASFSAISLVVIALIEHTLRL